MQYPITSLHGFRPGREEVSSLHLSTQHWFRPLPYLYRPSKSRASRFALDPYLSYFCPNKKPRARAGGERMHFRNLNVAPPKDENPMPIADLLVDRAAGQKFLSFMDGHLGYNQIFISKEDEAKTAFRCP